MMLMATLEEILIALKWTVQIQSKIDMLPVHSCKEFCIINSACSKSLFNVGWLVIILIVL